MNKHFPKDNQAILPIKNREHVAFLYDTFGSKPGEVLKLKTSHFAGQFIGSLRSYSRTPVEQSIPENHTAVVIEFPCGGLSTADNKFCYFKKEYIKQINDFIGSSFDLYFHWYFYDTSDLNKFEWEQMGMTEVSKLFLVESFIVGLGLADIDTAHETIKKREYRRELIEINRARQKYLKKDMRFRRRIFLKRRENLQNIMKCEV